MGFHHLAIATRDIKATHEFYTRAMGFELVKVVIAPSGASGFAKHVFYDTGDGDLMAFWDLHDDSLPADWNPAIATGIGLPPWTNHFAFDAADREDLEARKRRWLEYGVNVLEIDHGWCHSVYATDPNGILVEFCVSTRQLTAADAEEAQRLLADAAPAVPPAPNAVVHRAVDHRKG
jgi:catechol 2,3-dioxygenase-like lactoylglutathione lyase family enzyme